MDAELSNNENIAEEAAELGDDAMDAAVDTLRTDTVAQAKKMITHLVAVMDEQKATRVLRIIADLCTTNIAILTDLDPSGLLDGPRAKIHGGMNIGNGVVQGYPMVSGGMNNETFGAAALSQIVGLVPLAFQGQNIKHLTTAVAEARKTEGMEHLADELEAKLKNVLGTGDADAELDPEPVEEGPLRECMYCGREISKNEDMCTACSDKIEAGEEPEAALGAAS